MPLANPQLKASHLWLVTSRLSGPGIFYKAHIDEARTDLWLYSNYDEKIFISMSISYSNSKQNIYFFRHAWLNAR